MSGKPNYREAADLAVMTRFASGEIQQVELPLQPPQVDPSQVLTRELTCRLEFALSAGHADHCEEGRGAGKTMQADYLIEPSPEQVMEELPRCSAWAHRAA